MCACVHRYKNLTLCVCLYMCVICMYVLIIDILYKGGRKNNKTLLNNNLIKLNRFVLSTFTSKYLLIRKVKVLSPSPPHLDSSSFLLETDSILKNKSLVFS